MLPPVHPEPDVTTDVCEVDFPPAEYGGTLAEVEATIQDIVERVFRDDDDMLLSGVYGKTMRPITLDEIHDSKVGLGYWTLQEVDHGDA